jgi:hypothetical protein
MAHRAFGRTDIAAAAELAGGLYNTTYRVQPTGQPPVILRVAPRPARQSRVERALMRNEHAALPWFAPAERAPFWDTYGTPPAGPAAEWRALVCRARHIGAIRLERHRTGRHDTIADTYRRLRDVLDQLTGR